MQEKIGRGFGKNAGEWTGREARKKFLAVSVACLATCWPTPGFKGRTFKLCVLTRRDFNFFVRSSPLRVERGNRNRIIYVVHCLDNKIQKAQRKVCFKSIVDLILSIVVCEITVLHVDEHTICFNQLVLNKTRILLHVYIAVSRVQINSFTGRENQTIAKTVWSYNLRCVLCKSENLLPDCTE